jgi:ferredoxin-NADP reductase
MLSPSVRSLVLLVEGEPLTFVAGQWINLYVPTPAGELKRAYSIASGPADDTLELAVTLVRDGAASPTLHALTEGTRLEIDGPHGFFTRSEAEQREPSLFVATGTGLSPFRSMLREARTRPEHAPITLLFGCRTQADILYGDELMALSAADPAFRLEVSLSRPGAGWQGRTGYVQHHLAELVRELHKPAVYICGLTRMVSETRALLKGELGYDRKRIHSERYD